MKVLVATLLFCFGILSAQMPNISNVWLNNQNAYIGNFGTNSNLKFFIENAEQNKNNEQEFLINGRISYLENSNKVVGKMEIKKYKDSGKHTKIFGNYLLEEDKNSKDKGYYKGNFVFSFDWDRTTKQISNKQIVFKGNWYPYAKQLKREKTNWSN